MIKNDRQYQAAKRAAEGFGTTVENYPSSPPPEMDIHPKLWRAELDAISSQLAELREDLRAYEELRNGRRRVIEIRGWSDVPRALIEGRIAAGMTQRGLAEKLGLPEQAIQRYEATDYTSASLGRLQEIASAIGLSLAGLAAMADQSPTVDQFVQRIEELGVSRNWFIERLLPPSVAAVIVTSIKDRGSQRSLAKASKDVSSASTALVQAADVFRRVFQVDPGQLFSPMPLVLNPAVVGQTRYKRPRKKAAKGTQAFTFYAHYLALLTLEGSRQIPRRKLPRSGKEISSLIRDHYGALNFENSLRFVWSHGIPVLPLNDIGAFHGACWRTGGREVLVLKQRTPSEDRWTYDLWHEIGHILGEDGGDRFAVIEDAIPSHDDPQEQSAMAIAGDVVLNGRADELAERAMELVDNNVPMLDRVVTRVALEAGVSVGALANHLAFRIAQDSDGQISWWGSAAKFQRIDLDPWLIARDVLLEHLDFGRLNPIDRELLVRALGQPRANMAGQ